MPKEKIFTARPGQVDYTNIRWAPVVNCVVMNPKGEILVVERNKNMRLYPGRWNGISGFLDDAKSLKEKVVEELREELGIKARDIISIRPGEIFDQEAPKYKKTWIVHPVLVKVKSVGISLDWEATRYNWVTLARAKKLKLLPGFNIVLKNITKIL